MTKDNYKGVRLSDDEIEIIKRIIASIKESWFEPTSSDAIRLALHFWDSEHSEQEESNG
jgi:hypothetical protein